MTTSVEIDAAARLAELGKHQDELRRIHQPEGSDAGQVVNIQDRINGNLSDVDDEQDAESTGAIGFPELPPKAMVGALGEIVRVVAPTTEAHPAAIGAALLTQFGCLVGPDTYMEIANTRSPARLHTLLIGDTSTGAKGTAQGVADVIREEAVNALRRPFHTTGGLSSGEGLISLVQDPDEDDERPKDVLAYDKELMVLEEEFPALLKAGGRQGNTMLQQLRKAWDGKQMRIPTKNNPMVSTGAHICITGHGTPGEMLATIRSEAVDGGSMNRFLYVASKRVRKLSRGGNIPADVRTELGNLVADRVREARMRGACAYTADALRRWDEYYETSVGEERSGQTAKLLSRQAVMIHRIALALGLLDGTTTPGLEHLNGAIAWWDYNVASVEWMFQSSDGDLPEARGLVEFIAAAGDQGRTRTEIANEHFKKHKRAAEITAILAPLVRSGRVREVSEGTGGRSRTRYYAS